MKKLFKIEAKRKKDSVIEVVYVGAIGHDRAITAWMESKDMEVYSTVDVFQMSDTYDNFISFVNKKFTLD